jgi:para-aminobenzoate synthetase/4-amino-4-deoxychorismate lyase
MATMTSHPTPDPARGVFETMLVVDGEPVATREHLGRLEASVAAVYGTNLPARAHRVVAEHAADLELGRLRLTVSPAGRGAPPELGLEVDAGELDGWPHFPEQPIALRPHQVRGGLGCHKWADRAALPPAAPGEAPLLVDGDEVLEAAWANVFAVRDGAVFTPPLDGRILPGVTRATTIELARARAIEVVERTLTLEDLGQADEIFLTNSIRGVEIVKAVDEVRLDAPGPVTAALRDGLRAIWESKTAAPKGGRSLTA